ncbi:hypothetical protein BD289DRAFT_50747 [Coniella lustricola]|uniref:Uncharacterized protein n=1 Tax=Coniella lustricola TaxID=2025994 RepID=A0A2T3A1C5_9PEZI|nr:hypothetical protein BD289DRAFT_50747 [Coniella lustricola]
MVLLIFFFFFFFFLGFLPVLLYGILADCTCTKFLVYFSCMIMIKLPLTAISIDLLESLHVEGSSQYFVLDLVQVPGYLRDDHPSDRHVRTGDGEVEPPRMVGREFRIYGAVIRKAFDALLKNQQVFVQSPSGK